MWLKNIIFINLILGLYLKINTLKNALKYLFLLPSTYCLTSLLLPLKLTFHSLRLFLGKPLAVYITPVYALRNKRSSATIHAPLNCWVRNHIIKKRDLKTWSSWISRRVRAWKKTRLKTCLNTFSCHLLFAV